MSKIFYIGFPKTGSFSFYSHFAEITDKRLHNPNAVLEKVGYQKEWGQMMRNKMKTKPERFSEKFIQAINMKKLKEIINQNDVIADLPFMFLYPWLTENYPNAYYVYVSRNPQQWYQSMTVYFGSDLKNKDNNLFEAVFGSQVPGRSRKTYLKKYIQWNQAILDHFQEKPKIKFLSYDLSISNLEKTQLLRQFLPKEMVPKTNFPYNHYTKIKKQSYCNMSFYKFNFTNKYIDNVTFNNIDFRKTNLKNTFFNHCQFINCDMRSIKLSKTTFKHCSIDQDCLFDKPSIRLELESKIISQE